VVNFCDRILRGETVPNSGETEFGLVINLKNMVRFFPQNSVSTDFCGKKEKLKKTLQNLAFTGDQGFGAGAGAGAGVGVFGTFCRCWCFFRCGVFNFAGAGVFFGAVFLIFPVLVFLLVRCF
jgi:hypothetical protein